MSEADIDTLILKLQTHTPIGRLSHAEVRAALINLAELGYVITAPAAQ
jgi:hypothetical protein